ncbi:hypothetical protein LTR37_010221 [Vermiconidia calcicola]|uniref:Uncharacterized protein n=1 Tax=Vermiconidia calcicola TaxID=1690605 RepID=A0ACC3N5T0_9PEZI|nr:hypothetical protein LTR37_010221 [Vermiconidia calcicola]
MATPNVFALLSLILLLSMAVRTTGTVHYHPFVNDEHNNTYSAIGPSRKFVKESKSTPVMPNNMKRYYSVQQIPGGGVTDPNDRIGWPWPPVCEGGLSWLRFCFADFDTANHLVDILTEAIARWSAAYVGSSFRIQPDPACEGNYWCICSDLPNANGKTVSTDSLIIWDGTIDNDYVNRRKGTHCTTGYHYHSTVPWRHVMHFGKYHPKDPESMHLWWGAVQDMVHELGHAAGLLHEHLRPDARYQVDIEFKHIRGYNEALEAVRLESDGTFSKDSHVLERMDEVLESHELTRRYFPYASAFIPYTTGPPEFRGYVYSNNPSYFDFDSIIIYSSDYNAEYEDALVMTRQHPKENGDYRIWSGGSPDPQQALPSQGDIDRIKALYPLTDEDAPGSPMDVDDPGSSTDEDAPGSPEDKRAPPALIASGASFAPSPTQWSPVSVVIPGHVDTIIRPPQPYPSGATRPAGVSPLLESPDWDLYEPKIGQTYSTASS